jgi:NifB/MoaA-like Fe-S oxidoreductase
MLRNRRAGEALAVMKRFADAGISMNAQIVCCPGLNDGEELESTMRDLLCMHPALYSCSVVL